MQVTILPSTLLDTMIVFGDTPPEMSQEHSSDVKESCPDRNLSRSPGSGNLRCHSQSVYGHTKITVPISQRQ